MKFNEQTIFNKTMIQLINRISWKILVVGYIFLTMLYLHSFANYAIENFGGNRMIGTLILLTYFFSITVGLFKRPQIFSLISALNFLLGSLLFSSFAFAALPEINEKLMLLVLLGVLGLYISMRSYKYNDAL